MPYICYFARTDSAVPDLLILAAVDDAEARALALAHLDRNPHWRSVEVCDDQRTILRLERPTLP